MPSLIQSKSVLGLSCCARSSPRAQAVRSRSMEMTAPYSLAVRVTGKATFWYSGEAMVLHWKLATGPACVANVLLVPTAPIPLSTCNVTVGSTALTATLPVHTPETNVNDVGVTDSAPAARGGQRGRAIVAGNQIVRTVVSIDRLRKAQRRPSRDC